MNTILLVEDDALLLEVMCNILEAEGFEIHPANNGKQALDLFVNSMPDLIISDIMMPEMDGFELLQSVRNLPNGVTVPFLFLSARTERADVSRARSLGVDDYLFKPFDAPELIKRSAFAAGQATPGGIIRYPYSAPADGHHAGKRHRSPRPLYCRTP